MTTASHRSFTRNRCADLDLQLGTRVRTTRKTQGMSQAYLADRIGCSFQQVQKYESGANRLSVGTLLRISKAFGMKLEDFTHGLEDLV
jgi:transcriptional regulator with XRE-family HTH domain